MSIINTVLTNHLNDPDFSAKAHHYKTARVNTSLSEIFYYGQFVSVVRVRKIGARTVFYCRCESFQEYLFDYQLGDFCL